MAIATTKMIDNLKDGTTLVEIAQRANQDGNGNNIVNTYARTNGNYPNMTVGNAVNAETAASATKATQDSAGNNIVNTYATKSELEEGLAGKQPTGNYALQDGTYPQMTVGTATNATQLGGVAASSYARTTGTYSGMTVGNATHATSADSATTATTATTAQKVQYSLSFGSKTYNGSSAQTITAGDLGLANALIPSGSIPFASLPATPSQSNLGDVWNITDEFTTDSRFLEGAGKQFPAGTNVACIQSNGQYYYDVYGNFIDLSGYATTAYVQDTYQIKFNGTQDGIDIVENNIYAFGFNSIKQATFDGNTPEATYSYKLNDGMTIIAIAEYECEIANGKPETYQAPFQLVLPFMWDPDDFRVDSMDGAGFRIQLSLAVTTAVELAESAYQKPSTGIPESDLSQSVQNKLNSGDISAVYVSISSSAWANKGVTLTTTDYPGLSAVKTTSYLQFIADDASAASVINNGIDISGQGSGTVTFSCDAMPSAAVSGNVIVIG